MKKDYLYLSIIFILLVAAAAPYISGKTLDGADVLGAAVKETIYLECMDSDGLNPNFKGSAYGVAKVRGYDACQGDDVVEWYCSENKLLSANVPCKYGCSNGICKTTPYEPICTDPDELNISIQGTCESTSNGIFLDYCVNTANVAEYYCTQYNQCKARGFVCPTAKDCVDGACV
jgi:hypothetical protein